MSLYLVRHLNLAFPDNRCRNRSSRQKASGNVTLETVHKIGQTGVTYISSGSLTHSVKALDIFLKIDTELALKVGRRTGRA
ncbi:hypothetical protein L6164_026753 [Bauhinia variegata]|uniref:Uncharacterized protein n=1 Tax=Bauhinia variegata TaxID=167791 RepID=A0ACB9LRT0_BAUVA|nr:hypothetical protein L6164_026753 [Bauhinia variegata]